jgi:hypothetical protein
MAERAPSKERNKFSSKPAFLVKAQHFSEESTVFNNEVLLGS